MTTKVTSANWESEVIKSEIPVLVDLWAEWCGPCRTLGPILEELAPEYAATVKIVKVNVDEEPGISQAFEVQSIPTMAVVYQGGLVGKVVGFGGREHVKGLLDEVAAIPTKIAEHEAEQKAE